MQLLENINLYYDDILRTFHQMSIIYGKYETDFRQSDHLDLYSLHCILKFRNLFFLCLARTKKTTLWQKLYFCSKHGGKHYRKYCRISFP